MTTTDKLTFLYMLTWHGGSSVRGALRLESETQDKDFVHDPNPLSYLKELERCDRLFLLVIRSRKQFSVEPTGHFLYVYVQVIR